MRYSIYEENMERLEKKLVKIQNKCEKYGCFFHYEVVGEEYKEFKNSADETYILRYVIVDVEGKAEINNWRFIATIDFTEKGNIINRINNDIEVPERYYTTKPVCEHCNTNRSRKHAYIIMNTETGEFKQVGKACLKDFTGGLSAEGVTAYIAMYDSLIQGETPYEGCKLEHYIRVEDYLKCTYESIKHFGYARTCDSSPTCSRAMRYYNIIDNGGRYYIRQEREQIIKEMKEINFDINSEETTKKVHDALEWIKSQKESSNYIHNLKTACSLEFVKFNQTGIVASLAPTYDRNLVRQAEERARKEAEKVSEHVGNIGDRITFSVEDARALTGWATQWGYTWIYSFTDPEGNIYTWKTSKDIDLEEVNQITATVKAHNEYRGIKQTEITRGKVA